MKAYWGIGVILLGGILSFGGCKKHRQASAKHVFEQNLETNIKRCMEPLLKRTDDTIAVRTYCRCALEGLFRIDSNMVFLRGEELNEFLIKNLPKVDCELLPFMKQAPKEVKKEE